MFSAPPRRYRARELRLCGQKKIHYSYQFLSFLENHGLLRDRWLESRVMRRMRATMCVLHDFYLSRSIDRLGVFGAVSVGSVL